MPVIATIESITLQGLPDGAGGGINYLVTVQFSDSVSGYAASKNYTFPNTSAITTDKAVIQADLNSIKTAVASASSLQQYVGTVLT